MTISSSSSSAVKLQCIWYLCRRTSHHAEQFSFNAVSLRLPSPNLPSRLQYPRLASVSTTTSFQPQPTFTSSVGSPPPIPHQLTLTQRHLILLNVIAAATAISATWLFFSAIPTLLAFKRAAESLEKLLDVTREELPDTMAAVRLSGMEISDLTMELSDLGQEITQGVKSSTRAVRLAEERLRRLTNMNLSGGSPNETHTSRTSGS
uniref:uncharacterized protein LOC122588449 isoform X2 n=1 Tax=Erigeron canadensis TaxID=72917 RepID=UPI001CB90EAC|nr:uncharacterized protein LOC122588449 isoform X2 [Erigeron canadensis]